MERLDDQAGMARSYHQLGILAQQRGDYDTAEPLYRRALEIKERLGDQAGMAASYHQLGMLAQVRGDYDAAETLYRRSLEISERLGDQAGMAASYDQLGMLAQRGDYDAAEPSTAAPWKSASGSATRPAWPPATTSSACWPSCGGTTPPPSPSTAAPWKSASHGNQVGMAASYHEPESWPSRGRTTPPLSPSTAISGNQKRRRPGRHRHQLRRPSQLERGVGNLDQAIAYWVDTLAIRLQIGTATARDVQRSPGCAAGAVETVSGPPGIRPG